jgi:AbrB family looped-hinge helix DNA binding protein
MSTIVEIDKAGRIVVPKKLRDAMHLVPGTQLRIERAGDRLTLRPNSVAAQLVIENGVPLIYPADEAPILTDDMVTEMISQGRLDRENRALGTEEDPIEESA